MEETLICFEIKQEMNTTLSKHRHSSVAVSSGELPLCKQHGLKASGTAKCTGYGVYETLFVPSLINQPG